MPSDPHSPAAFVTLGRIAGAFGVQGWVRVAAFTARPEDLGRYPVWKLRRDGGPGREARLLEGKPHGSSFLARLAGCEDRETAAAMRGLEVAVPRSALPPPGPGEFYQADLVGLAVVNMKGARIGQLSGMFGNSAHEVMRVAARDDSGRAVEKLLPFVPQVVKSVDLASREIRVEWELDW